MKKAVYMILLAVFLLINLNLIFARSNNSVQQNVTLSYPKEVNYGQEFTVNITMYNFPSDSYGVRLGVINDSIRLARVWNGTYWQSTYYYINNAINTIKKKTESFRLNVTSCYNGNANIELKLRDSKDNLYSFYNYTINIIANCSPPHNNQTPINNTPINYTTSNTTTRVDDTGISLNLDWSSEDIKNGRDFQIKINVYNLQDKDYDLKIFIYDNKENSPISQVYNDGKWISSTNYASKIFRGPGNKTKDIKLRIKDSYKDFDGEATIAVRIRESGSSNYKKEIQSSIEVLEKDNNNNNNNNNSSTQDSDKTDNDNKINKSNDPNLLNPQESISYSVEEDVVHQLSSNSKSESIKTKKNTVYKSKNEKIKEYSMLVFMILTLIFFSLFIYNKLR